MLHRTFDLRFEIQGGYGLGPLHTNAERHAAFGSMRVCVNSRIRGKVMQTVHMQF